MQYRKTFTAIGAGVALTAAIIFIFLGAFYSTVTSWWNGLASSAPREVAMAAYVTETSSSDLVLLSPPTVTTAPTETLSPSDTPAPATPTVQDTLTPSATIQPTLTPTITNTPAPTSTSTASAPPTVVPTLETPGSDVHSGSGMGLTQESAVDSWVTSRQFQSLPGFVYSPAGVFQSLALVSLGASDRSRNQIDDFLGSDSHAQCRAMNSLVAGNDRVGHLDLSVWGDSKAIYDPGYLDLLMKCAQTRPQPVSQSDVLSWISGKIPGFTSPSASSLVPKGVGPGDGLLVVSASRFLFDWSESGPSVEDGRGTFILPSGQPHEVSYRRLSGDFLYYQTDKIAALTITQLDERRSLILATPRMGGGFSYDFFKMFTPEEIRKIVDGSKTKQVDARLPSFDVFSSWDMTDALVTNGVSNIFFPGIASLGFSLPGGEPYVSKVLHVSQIKLDSIARDPINTNSIFFTSSAPISTAPVFFLDRPFVVIVVDRETNDVLAKGYVLDAK